MLSQKAKIHWLKIGDVNNKQFHKADRVREFRNAICEIKRAYGKIADTHEEIKKRWWNISILSWLTCLMTLLV